MMADATLKGTAGSLGLTAPQPLRRTLESRLLGLVSVSMR
jgi:hypothetical protein